MTYYGPWVQAPDYAQTGDLESGPGIADTGEAHSMHTGGDFKDPLATAAEVQSLQESANADVGSATVHSGDTTGFPISAGPMQYATNYTGGVFPPWETHMLARWWFNLRGVSRYTDALANWAPPLLGYPDGAIGWQWQSDLTTDTPKVSDAVACEVNLGLTGGGLDNSVDPDASIGPFKQDFWLTTAEFTADESTIPGGFYEDAITAWDGVAAKEALLLSVEDGLEDTWVVLDLTDHLDATGRAAFFTQMDFATYSPLVPGDLTVDEAGVGYGYAFANYVAWTFRPPVFRWIFEGFETTPPLRHTQRDDHRNTGLNSRQRSLRNTGYL